MSHIVDSFLRDLLAAVQATSSPRSSDVTVNGLTDPERVEAVLKEAEAALGEPKKSRVDLVAINSCGAEVAWKSGYACLPLKLGMVLPIDGGAWRVKYVRLSCETACSGDDVLVATVGVRKAR